MRYPSICTQCSRDIDLNWFNEEKLAGRLPVVHACNRVLYRGAFAHIGEAGIEAEGRKAMSRLKSKVPLPVGTKAVHIASTLPREIPSTLPLPIRPASPTPSKAPFRQTRPCEQCGESVVVERSTKRFCGGSCRKLASRERLKSDRSERSGRLSDVSR